MTGAPDARLDPGAAAATSGSSVHRVRPPSRSIRPVADLFSAAVDERLARQAPLAARLRPRTLDEVVGQGHLLGPGAPLRALIEADRLSSVICGGRPARARRRSPGSSRAPTAQGVRAALGGDRRGQGRARGRSSGPARRLGEQGQGTILFLDEVHRFNKAQQDALLPRSRTGRSS